MTTHDAQIKVLERMCAGLITHQHLSGVPEVEETLTTVSPPMYVGADQSKPPHMVRHVSESLGFATGLEEAEIRRVAAQ